jgi:hypothetical protein
VSLCAVAMEADGRTSPDLLQLRSAGHLAGHKISDKRQDHERHRSDDEARSGHASLLERFRLYHKWHGNLVHVTGEVREAPLGGNYFVGPRVVRQIRASIPACLPSLPS